MNNVRCVNLYTHNTHGQTVISSFCFPKSAIKAAREMGFASFVVAIEGRIVHVEGPIEPFSFMRGAA